MIPALRDFLTNPIFLWIWIGLVLVSLGVLIRDLRENNAEMPSLMKWVWGATVLYSGPIGLALYWKSGRKQIENDSLWRRGVRSTCHCYSGCGAGEVTGIIIAVGILALSTWWVAAITFSLAYVAGYALTVGPLVQEGVPFGEAMWDAFLSETASITVMEVVAIGVDIWLAGEATMGEPLFWSALFFSLSMGLLAAYPVNVLLVRFGVKEGMMDPRDYGEM
ncbi:MAG: DUF4396 domain-containing protein [Gemmatimonadota bacterium]|nr:DUF4396 domain-containing protein [Gemmatimonadota bacterium]